MANNAIHTTVCVHFFIFETNIFQVNCALSVAFALK